jgi:antitoxin MazE
VLTKVQKWGNSLGLRIPKAFAEEAGVAAGSEVILAIIEGGLIVRPAHPRKYPLDELLHRVTAENRHAEVDAGGAVGREAW